MKKAVRLIIAILLCISLAGCSTAGNTHDPVSTETPVISENPDPDVTPEDNEVTTDNEGEKNIIVYCDTVEMVQLIKKFQGLHPDFGYEIVIYTEYYYDENPNCAHDMMNGYLDVEPPDIYCVARENIYRFTKGSDHQYALPLEELGLDVEKLVREAGIPQYMLDLCSNPDGKLVALCLESNAGAFIYRRSIAKKVWGTDDPAVIKDKIGPGWDKFMEAAAELGANGYSICSSIQDIWRPFEMNVGHEWLRDGQLTIAPERENFLDYARTMVEKGYVNNTIAWTDKWFADMSGEGEREVFGFFGPYWMVLYNLMGSSGGESVGEGTYGDWAVCDPPAGYFWGGTMIMAHRNTRHKEAVGEIIRWLTLDTTETGAQYLWASGEITGNMGFPASAAVAQKLEYKLDFLGGQDLFEAYLSANQHARANNLSEYDDALDSFWVDEVMAYAEGRKSRDQAIADFRNRVEEYLEYEKEWETRKKNRKSEIDRPIEEKDYKGVIRVYSDSGDIKTALDKFLELHPDFEYKIDYLEFIPIELLPDLLHGKLDSDPPDIYSMQTYYVITYTQGREYRHAAPYEDLGIDVKKIIKETAVPKYMIDLGTSPEGKIVALGYDSAAAAFLYRRSIARKVWGTDEPAVIRDIIGPGWDRFLGAAADLAREGYAICSEIYDLWAPSNARARQGWVKNGMLVVDPEREAFLDYAQVIVRNGYISNARWWTQEWFEQMTGKGENEIFGYMAPYWFASMTLIPMAGDTSDSTYGDWAICDPPRGFAWGGTMVFANKNTQYKDAVAQIIRWLLDTSETGCQNLIAKGELYKGEYLPASTAVMGKYSRNHDFFGGQDVFKAYLSATRYAKAGFSEFNSILENIWLDEAWAYAEGRKSRDQAVADFKKRVAADFPDLIVQ